MAGLRLVRLLDVGRIQLGGGERRFLFRQQAMQHDPRVADVVARLPNTLTGIPETMKSNMLTEAAEKRNPGEAKDLATLNEALQHAQEGLANAARTIAQDAKLDAAQYAPYAYIGSAGDAPNDEQAGAE